VTDNVEYKTLSPDTGAIPRGVVIETEQQLDGSQRQVVKVGESALPTGAATSANQTNKTQMTQITDGTNQAAIITGDFTGVKGLRVYGGPTDPISDIPVHIDYGHHQVHEGESHEENILIASLGLNASQDFRLNVPAGLTPTTRTPHVIFEVISTLEAELYLFEDMTFTVGNGGTLQTSYNRNRNSSVVPGMKIYLTPVPATTGTNIWIGLIGSGNRAGGGDRAQTEWDFKPAADYLFRVTSRAASNKILVRILWYEDLGV